jgi:hypothetical protein
MKQTLHDNAYKQFETYIVGYERSYNDSLPIYNQEVDKIVNSYNAMVAGKKA